MHAMPLCMAYTHAHGCPSHLGPRSLPPPLPTRLACVMPVCDAHSLPCTCMPCHYAWHAHSEVQRPARPSWWSCRHAAGARSVREANDAGALPEHNFTFAEVAGLSRVPTGSLVHVCAMVVATDSLLSLTTVPRCSQFTHVITTVGRWSTFCRKTDATIICTCYPLASATRASADAVLFLVPRSGRHLQRIFIPG